MVGLLAELLNCTPDSSKDNTLNAGNVEASVKFTELISPLVMLLSTTCPLLVVFTVAALYPLGKDNPEKTSDKLDPAVNCRL